MEIRLNNLINNSKLVLYINSNDTVNDIKSAVCYSLYPYQRINPSGTALYFIDKNTNQINYMLSPFRTILSYKGIFQTKELFIEQSGYQINKTLAIFLENFIPMKIIYNLYSNEGYDKLFLHKNIFFLNCFYFICRFLIKLKIYKDIKYSFLRFTINNIIFSLFYSYFCGDSFFSDELNEMNFNCYLYSLIFIFCDLLSLKFVKEYKNNNQNKNILFNYVKYPFYLMDCIIWLSLMGIVYNKKIILFTFIKIFYNIYLSLELYVEERGIKKGNNYLNNNIYGYNNINYNNNFELHNSKKNVNQKLVFSYTL